MVSPNGNRRSGGIPNGNPIALGISNSGVNVRTRPVIDHVPNRIDARTSVAVAGHGPAAIRWISGLAENAPDWTDMAQH